LLRKASALDLQAVFDSRKYRRFIIARCAWLESQQQLATALGARMLREEKENSLRALCRRAVSEPCSQWDLRGVLWGDARHVEHNGAEASSLQKQICDTESLLNARPLPGRVHTNIRESRNGS
jgi:hypothetical protein